MALFYLATAYSIMHVYPAEIDSADAWTESRYRIEFETPGLDTEVLRFSVPDSFANWISSRMEAPVMATLFLAMALGESITVDAPLSPQYYYGLRQIQNYFHLWYPDSLSKVEIRCAGFEEASSAATGVATCFSGGVDSVYTLWQQHQDREPLVDHQIRYGLFAHGFDIALEDRGFYDALADTYEQALAQERVQLVRCRTNLRSLIESRVTWLTLHGAAIQAVGLFLQAGLRRLFIPSTNRVSLLNPPIGSNPYTDPQAATECLDLIHHGSEMSRIQKILAIADWPLAQRYLRVCFQKPDTYPNCGKCPKCLKVMAPLWAIDKLQAFATFPPGFEPESMGPECFAGIDFSRYASERTYGEELCDLVRSTRPDAVDRVCVREGQAPQRIGLLDRVRRLL